MKRTVAQLWCRIVGHDWCPIASTFRVCARCGECGWEL